MEQLVTCNALQIDEITSSDKDIASSMHKKSSKKSLSKKRKIDKKKHKKHKKKRRSSSSSSETDDSDEFEWVEKKDKGQTSSYNIENSVNNEIQENPLKRDEWMNVESFLPYLSKSDIKKQKLNTKEEDKTKNLLDKPGQSDRELNPYWKDGGDGLPKISPGRLDNSQVLDANWLKKSLRRAEEQARRDGKTLEEVATERWGSLETIQSMIINAEKMSNAEQNKYFKKHYNVNRHNKDLHRISSSRLRNRSRSRSRSRERTGKYTPDYFSHHIKKKQSFQRPNDSDNYYQQTTHSSTSRLKNSDRKHESGLIESSRLEETKTKNISNINEMDKNKNIDILTEAEMNKLGAKIIKAEIMGDNELAAQLKVQLEQARKLSVVNTNVQEETVILTKTDAKGVARPIQPRSQSKQFAESHRKKKSAETHVSGERVCYFADDNKYSLQEMFQREKGRSTNEDEGIFTKLVAKNADHVDDMFEQQIAQTNSEEKQDRRDRSHAIKEHIHLSNSMENCSWCLDSKNMLKHMIVTMDSMICLSLPAYTSLTTSQCILTPIQHVACQLQLDEDVWYRLKEFKKKLIKMFMKEDLYPIFFEVYKKRRKFSHMQLECIPLPKETGESAPLYFKKALLECETEWSINKKIVDLKDKDIRHAVPNGLSYFMVEFASHPGYAHVIEDEEMFPKNFAEEIIGGMLDVDCNLWRKPKRQSFDEQRAKMLKFTEIWKKYNSSQSEDI
ncbi:CWF19-like protein 2 [Formica fusca]